MPPIFCQKKLAAPERVCLRLKKTRENLGLDLDTVAAETHISKKYLEAIEACDFSALPKARAYRTAYLRAYASALKINPESIIHQFTKEEGFDDITNIHPKTGIRNSRFASLSVLARNLFLVFFILAFAVYLIWQVHRILTPPELVIYAPMEGSVTDSLSVLVQGKTEPECQLSINGRNVMPNDQGKFESPVDITSGVNTITISAIKKHGKTSAVTIHVVKK